MYKTFNSIFHEADIVYEFKGEAEAYYAARANVGNPKRFNDMRDHGTGIMMSARNKKEAKEHRIDSGKDVKEYMEKRKKEKQNKRDHIKRQIAKESYGLI